jgi:hypothetical protein
MPKEDPGSWTPETGQAAACSFEAQSRERARIAGPNDWRRSSQQIHGNLRWISQAVTVAVSRRSLSGDPTLYLHFVRPVHGSLQTTTSRANTPDVRSSLPSLNISIMASQDELTATVFGAVQSLSNTRKANLLLDTALALIHAGQYVRISTRFQSSPTLQVWGRSGELHGGLFQNPRFASQRCGQGVIGARECTKIWRRKLDCKSRTRCVTHLKDAGNGAGDVCRLQSGIKARSLKSRDSEPLAPRESGAWIATPFLIRAEKHCRKYALPTTQRHNERPWKYGSE